MLRAVILFALLAAEKLDVLGQTEGGDVGRLSLPKSLHQLYPESPTDELSEDSDDIPQEANVLDPEQPFASDSGSSELSIAEPQLEEMPSPPVLESVEDTLPAISLEKTHTQMGSSSVTSPDQLAWKDIGKEFAKVMTSLKESGALSNSGFSAGQSGNARKDIWKQDVPKDLEDISDLEEFDPKTANDFTAENEQVFFQLVKKSGPGVKGIFAFLAIPMVLGLTAIFVGGAILLAAAGGIATLVALSAILLCAFTATIALLLVGLYQLTVAAVRKISNFISQKKEENAHDEEKLHNQNHVKRARVNRS